MALILGLREADTPVGDAASIGVGVTSTVTAGFAGGMRSVETKGVFIGIARLASNAVNADLFSGVSRIRLSLAWLTSISCDPIMSGEIECPVSISLAANRYCFVGVIGGGLVAISGMGGGSGELFA